VLVLVFVLEFTLVFVTVGMPVLLFPAWDVFPEFVPVATCPPLEVALLVFWLFDVVDTTFPPLGELPMKTVDEPVDVVLPVPLPMI